MTYDRQNRFALSIESKAKQREHEWEHYCNTVNRTNATELATMLAEFKKPQMVQVHDTKTDKRETYRMYRGRLDIRQYTLPIEDEDETAE